MRGFEGSNKEEVDNGNGVEEYLQVMREMILPKNSNYEFEKEENFRKKYITWDGKELEIFRDSDGNPLFINYNFEVGGLKYELEHRNSGGWQTLIYVSDGNGNALIRGATNYSPDSKGFILDGREVTYREFFDTIDVRSLRSQSIGIIYDLKENSI